MTRPPNILWIMADQFRADCLGCAGHPAARTPNLDRLAARGVQFENAFCQSPVCMASRASLFTGRYPATIGVRGMGILPPRETTTPEWLRRHGYRTGAFGKVHLTPELYTRQVLGRDTPTLDLRLFAEAAQLGPIPDDPLKTNYGFEEHVGVDDALKGRFHAWLRAERPELAERQPDPIPDSPRDVWISPYPADAHPTTFIARQAESYIRARAGQAPWLTFCSFVAPHHPFEAPADIIARFDGADIPLPALKGGVDGSFIPEPARAALQERDRWSPEAWRRIVLHYLASIALIDDQVGRLLAALEETGQAADTLVVFTADHGEFLGQHGLLRKPSLHYDEVLRVPLLMAGPGLPAGRRVPGLVELTDLHPTLLGLAGLPVNPGVQGTDWSAALKSGGPLAREDIHSAMFQDCVDPRTCMIVSGGPYMAVQTIRTPAWKLNIYPTAGPAYGQLFDLARDPDESRNLYADPACQDIRHDLLWRLAGRIAAQTDPLPRVLSQW